MKLLAIAVTVLCGCKDVDKVEHVPKGGPPVTFDTFFKDLKSAIQGGGGGRVQTLSDDPGAMVISTKPGACAKYKSLIRADLPDGVDVVCREDGEVKWELDRR